MPCTQHQSRTEHSTCHCSHGLCIKPCQVYRKLLFLCSEWWWSGQKYSDVCTLITAIIEPCHTTHIDILLKVEDDSIDLLTVLDLFWQAAALTHDSFPKTFNCLIDVGSHPVIIWESLVNKKNFPYAAKNSNHLLKLNLQWTMMKTKIIHRNSTICKAKTIQSLWPLCLKNSMCHYIFFSMCTSITGFTILKT